MKASGYISWSSLRLAVVLVLLLPDCKPVQSQVVQEHYYSLMTYLFDDYKKEVRPTLDDTATTVYVSFWLLSIQHLDEQNQVLQTSAVIETMWIDPWLTWDPANYGNISMFRYEQKKLWLPDVVVLNSVQSQTQLGYDSSPVMVNSDGNVLWYPSEIIETSCSIDVTYYPFDTQTCGIVVSTWVSQKEQIDLDLYPNMTDVVKDRFSPSGTWELIGTTIKALPNLSGTTRLEYSFKLKRLSTFYVLNMILPVLLLSMSASGVFFLPAEAGEKIGMSMTVLLAFAVYLTIISDKMPQTSLQISILSIYLSMLLAVTALTVLFSVFSLHLHHKSDDEKIGKKTMRFTVKMRKLLRCTPKTNDDESRRSSVSYVKDNDKVGLSNTMAARLRNGKITPANDSIKIKVNSSEKSFVEEKITWQLVAATVDYVLFITTSVFILALTVIVMLLLVIGGNSV